ncbi:MAG: hypothetical protein UX07_C0014G0009 [Parcubacteria group bacterium GW2011_GWA2_45_30]|nr:MAG: hypothetical protein UX07_C0014G0009 [Parcubacteria group bacterium GW2011_GWA2_45_30]
MLRYKILKFFFGILSLAFFFQLHPKRHDEDVEERDRRDAELKALQMEKAHPDMNVNAHFFVSCGGFIS